MLQEVYGEFVLPYSTARRWYKLFKNRRHTISNEGGPSAPITALMEENSNSAAVIVREDRRITLRSLWNLENFTGFHSQPIIFCKTADSRRTGRLHAIEDCGTGRSRVSFNSNHCWWNLATSFWSWEQTAKLCVEISITNPQKAKAVSSAGKVMVISFFILMEWFISMSYLHTNSNWLSFTTEMSWKFCKVLSDVKVYV